MNFSDLVAAVIGGGFGIILLGAISTYVVAKTIKFCMPIFRDVYQEYTKWRMDRAKEDAEFIEVYRIYKRMNKKHTPDSEDPAPRSE